MIQNLSVKTGDKVLVIAGKDNGKVAKIISTSPKANKVVVEGVNIATKHQKAKKQDEKSKIVKVEAAFDASNVMVICPNCDKATRVAHAVIAGKKSRVCKKCGQSLDKAIIKAAKKEASKAVKTETAEKASATKTAKVTATKKVAAPRAPKKELAVKPTSAKSATKVATRMTAPSSGK